MPEYPLELYSYEELPNDASLRVLELLPGAANDPISCLLHVADWSDPPRYEAVSYTWGDAQLRVPIICQGKRFDVTVNLHQALHQFRYEDQSRFLWTDLLW